MPIEPARVRPFTWIWVEAALLLVVTPFLLFPTFFIPGTVIALLLLVAAWCLPLLLWRQPLLPPTPFNVAVLFWSLALIVGILVTADPDLTLPKATGLILGLAVWRYLAWAIQSRYWLRWSVAGFVLLGSGFTLLGVLGAEWLTKVPLLEGLISRLPAQLIALPESGTAGVHTNQLAATILIYLPLLISILFTWRLRRSPAFAGLLFITLLTAGVLVLTQSRSGWIGMAGGLLVLLGLWAIVLPPSRVRRLLWFSLAGGIFLIVIGLALIGPARLEKMWTDPQQETAVGNLGTLSFRQEVWRWGLAGISDFPFTGSGLGTFRRVVRRFYPLAVVPTYDIAHVHNIFLQTALDIGLPGLVAYVAILGIAGAIGWHVARQDREWRPLALGLLAGLAALHIFGLTDALAIGSKPGLLFWVLIGLLTAMHRINSCSAVLPALRTPVKAQK